MKRNLFIGLAVLALTISLPNIVHGQKFQFEMIAEELQPSQSDKILIGSHFLGEEIAEKLYLLKKGYTWEEEESPTNPAPKTHIEKPEIYKSIRSLEKFYKKGVRKGIISEEVAKEEFSQILDIAIVIRHQRTEDLEETLSKIKSEENIVGLFKTNIVIL